MTQESKIRKAKITIAYTFSEHWDAADIVQTGMTFIEMVQWVLKEEGQIIGIVDDDYEIISVEEV